MRSHDRRAFRPSAAGHLALRFSLLISLMILVLSVVLVMLLKNDVRVRQDKELSSALSEIASDLPGTASDYTDDGDGMMLSTELPYYIVFSVYRSGTQDVVETNDPFLPLLPLTGPHAVRYREKDYFIDGDLNILYKAKEYQTADGMVYTVQAALNMDRDTAEQFVTGLPRMLLIILIPLMFMSFWAALLMTRQTLRPVERMTETAREIGSANLDRRLPVTGKGDELDTLACTFNDLFARLESDFDRERQFTSNVSHELKTPVAVISGHANLLRRWGKDDPVQLDKSIAALTEESRTMELIIGNMLQLSRLESGAIKPDSARICLHPLFVRLAEDTHAWCPSASFEEDVHDSSACVAADEELLYQCFTILVSNSVKFAPSPVRIAIGVSVHGGETCIAFTDNGPGFAPDVLPHVFERFYRGDPSHNRNAGGAGLGLAIAKVIVEAMHGTVAAANAPGGGAELTLTLPSA